MSGPGAQTDGGQNTNAPPVQGGPAGTSFGGVGQHPLFGTISTPGFGPGQYRQVPQPTGGWFQTRQGTPDYALHPNAVLNDQTNANDNVLQYRQFPQQPLGLQGK